MYRVFLIAVLIFPTLVNANKISVGVTEWGGYTNADGSGKYLELLYEIFGKDKLDLNFTSYLRMLHQFEQGNSDFIIGLYREESPTAIFPNWYLDREYSVQAFYKSSRHQIDHLSDFNNYVVAWIRGYGFERYLPITGDIYKVNDQDHGFKLLENDRVDVFIDFEYNLPESAALSKFEILPERKIYIAFANNEKGKELAKQYDEGMLSLRNSGKLKAIFTDEYEFSQFDSFEHDTPQIILHSRDNHLLSSSKHQQSTSLESQVLNYVLPQLTEFNIDVAKYTSFKNDNEYYQNKINHCIVNKAKTPERENNFAFSLPFVMYTGMRLYSLYQLPVAPNAVVNLNNLLRRNPGLNLGLAPGHYFPKHLQEQINKINSKQIVQTTPDVIKQLNELLINKYKLKIEYPALISNNWNNLSDKTLYSYALPGEDEYTLGHLMCAKSEQSQRFLAKFNKVLQQTYKEKVFKSLIQQASIGVNPAKFDAYFEQAFVTNKLVTKLTNN